MTETAQEAKAAANGSAPDEPCADCATGGEKILAVIACAVGVLVIAIAIDMFTGGAIGRLFPRQVSE
jgi:hypothetical protein